MTVLLIFSSILVESGTLCSEWSNETLVFLFVFVSNRGVLKCVGGTRLTANIAGLSSSRRMSLTTES